MENIKLRIQSAPWYSGFELMIGGENKHGQLEFGEIHITTREDGIAPIAPTMSLTPQQAQELMDSMWQSGLRPSDGTGSAGQLAATENHLKDMRKIAGDFMDKVLEK